MAGCKGNSSSTRVHSPLLPLQLDRVRKYIVGACGRNPDVWKLQPVAKLAFFAHRSVLVLVGIPRSALHAFLHATLGPGEVRGHVHRTSTLRGRRGVGPKASDSSDRMSQCVSDEGVQRTEKFADAMYVNAPPRST